MTANRTHSVVVRPKRWSGTTAELARLLAPVTGVDVTPLTALLARGPMTVEADLSPDDARRLHERLSTLGVPSVIRPNSSGLSDSEVSEVSEDSSASTSGDIAIPGTFASTAAPPASTPATTPTGRRSTVLGMKPMRAEESSGWGQLFPDLEAERTKSEADETHPPSLDDLAGDSVVEGEEVEEANHLPPALKPDRLRDTLPGEKTADLEDSATEEATPTLGSVPSGAPSEPPSDPRSEPQSEPPSETMGEPETPVVEASIPPPQPPEEPRSPSQFDASKLHGLVARSEDERAPYEPAGFDDRPEHHPQFAAAFSVFAPGAGQVFNGDEDEALDYGLRFWLVKPWIDSVQEAREKAEKIHTYFAPRPPAGTFAKAVKYAVAWWLSVILISTLVIWSGGKLYEIATREPEPEGVTPEQVAAAMEDSRTGILAARVAGLDALQKATAEIEISPQFSMSEEERASRIYALGFVECKNRNYVMCEQMMKRVAKLRPGFRPALKLQTWASVRRRGGTDPMPEVEDAPSLTDFELDQLRQEMVMQGENVPPPPKRAPDREDRDRELSEEGTEEPEEPAEPDEERQKREIPPEVPER